MNEHKQEDETECAYMKENSVIIFRVSKDDGYDGAYDVEEGAKEYF